MSEWTIERTIQRMKGTPNVREVLRLLDEREGPTRRPNDRLAALVGCSPRTIGHWVSGRKPPSLVLGARLRVVETRLREHQLPLLGSMSVKINGDEATVSVTVPLASLRALLGQFLAAP